MNDQHQKTLQSKEYFETQAMLDKVNEHSERTMLRRQRQARQKKKQKRAAVQLVIIVLTCLFIIFFLGTLFGWHLGASYGSTHNEVVTFQSTATATTVTVRPATTTATEPAASKATAATTSQTSAPSKLSSNRITAGGTLLPYELQECMFRNCEKYEVPYALALALAEHESAFDPNAESATNDVGLMQINRVNFDYLYGMGLDPMTYEGNIEAGILFISQKIALYGDTEQALMAYNCGDAGAQHLWDSGVQSTDYSASVMALRHKWESVLEEV